MGQFFKMFFASLLALIIAGVLGFFIVAGSIAMLVSKSLSKKEKSAQENSILVIDLSKTIHEQGQNNSLAALNNDPAYEPGLYDITRSVTYAKTDNNIKGIVIKLAPSPNGWATLEQLRMAITDFKGSGKFVYAYGDDITQGAYYVASAADSIYLNPVGDMEFKGMATVLAFFKGALDKLEVQPEIFYAGKFKSATEPFRANKISDPNRLQIAEMQSSFWNEFIAAVAQHSHLDTTAVSQLAKTGAIQFPSDALKNKLVDGLLYSDQVEQRIRAAIGLKDTQNINYVKLDDYVSNTREEGKIADARIAVLFAEGDIVDGEQSSEYQIASQDMITEIRKLAKNDRIKAVVLRVNSPGGSALASENILRELQLLKQKKPLIVSMGDYAASGGYYISCEADSIFAMPNTITGSIGVFSVLFNIESLMKNKLGITFDEVKNAPYADIPTTSRPLSAGEAQRMQNSVNNIYGIFKNRVAAGRNIDTAMVDSIAQGRVWTGTDALKIRLVDAMGGLDRAIQSAATMAKVTNYKVVTYPEPEDKLQTLLRKLKGNAIMTSALKSEMGDDYQWYEKIKELKGMNGKTMMITPFVLSAN